MTERIVDARGATLCTEPFGDPTAPSVLLVMGLGASMLWWDEELCRRLAAGGDRPHPPLSSISAPTLVIHGTADPLFPLPHGEALVEEIPDATLLTIEGAGHGIDQVDWPTIVTAILDHTART